MVQDKLLTHNAQFSIATCLVQPTRLAGLSVNYLKLVALQTSVNCTTTTCHSKYSLSPGCQALLVERYADAAGDIRNITRFCHLGMLQVKLIINMA